VCEKILTSMRTGYDERGRLWERQAQRADVAITRALAVLFRNG